MSEAGGLLEGYGRLARHLYPLRKLFYLGAVVGLGFFVYALAVPLKPEAGGAGTETRMLLPLVGVLWCVAIGVFVQAFNTRFPVVDPEAGWFARQRVRLVRAAWHLLAMGVAVFGVVTLWLTVRALVMYGT